MTSMHTSGCRRIAGRIGFTLLEVMMAVTIFGIVALTVYGTFARTLRSKGIAEERAQVVQAGRGAVARMGDELASAFYPSSLATGSHAATAAQPIFRSLSGGTETLPLDAIVFTALSSRPAGVVGRDSDQRIISYFFPERRGPMRPGMDAAASRTDTSDVEDFFAAFGPQRQPRDGETPERLLRREAIMASRDALDAATATAFLDDVASLEFRFHDGTDWVDEWDSEDQSNFSRLPRAVAIDLALYDARGDIHHFITSVDVALADTRPAPRSSGGPGTGASKTPRPARSPAATE
jgi:prepilin-type N-terminal cleavage/methylation domain-containing protein